ncbi:MAG: aminotransferase class V-fold PLP-dependent enzyme, partial [Pirellulaceae bacterium]|nr:aminotransferase class V-fold PLP-dependent enzyme [Pirellulaceae bacterium]
EYATVAELRDRLESSLLALGNVEVIAKQSQRLPHVSNVAFLGLDRQAVQMALDLSGIACSTGSACASGSSRPSHVLTAMGLSPTVINGSIRFSLSRNTTAVEIDSAIELIARVLKKIIY